LSYGIVTFSKVVFRGCFVLSHHYTSQLLILAGGESLLIDKVILDVSLGEKYYINVGHILNGLRAMGI
jgi:hypothetical protein